MNRVFRFLSLFFASMLLLCVFGCERDGDNPPDRPTPGFSDRDRD